MEWCHDFWSGMECQFFTPYPSTHHPVMTDQNATCTNCYTTECSGFISLRRMQWMLPGLYYPHFWRMPDSKCCRDYLIYYWHASCWNRNYVGMETISVGWNKAWPLTQHGMYFTTATKGMKSLKILQASWFTETKSSFDGFCFNIKRILLTYIFKSLILHLLVSTNVVSNDRDI